MSATTGNITGINGNMVSVKINDRIMQNEVAFIINEKEKLKSEVLRINDNIAYLQVFENTKGLKVGDHVEFTGSLLSVQLGPGLLSQIYDGLQNPLPLLAEEYGFFIPRGVDIVALDMEKNWAFAPDVKKGDEITKGLTLGYVPESIFKHQILVPFYMEDTYIVEKIASKGEYKIKDTIAELKDSRGNIHKLTMNFYWPVRIPINAYQDKIVPEEPLETQTRIIDSFFPISKGGTYCIPGPFGAGKTVMQQIISKYAQVDIVIIAACGERAGEVVETLRTFPEIEDPRTGKSLIERTIIICNTSSMPVAARESSIYTAVTLGEYYRQMGLNVLLLADSTSRWAQAMRELSGRLEEIPGEEAFPAYLESRIAEFYERSGLVELYNGKRASLTIGGTVSPAGGNFDEPVTQATLKVVGAFLGLSRDRANARRFPAIHPLESWSKYKGFIEEEKIKFARDLLFKGEEVRQMMMVVGEEGTSDDDFITYLKSELLDNVYLQQNAFDRVDAACNADRQNYIFEKLLSILKTDFHTDDKNDARELFNSLRQLMIDWNYMEINTDKFKEQEEKINKLLVSKKPASSEPMEEVIQEGEYK